jgi:ubiquinone/menaquinone biosynthesis C-methylase UbiE
MTTRGPLAEPLPWNLVSKDYSIEVVPQFEKFAADALCIAGTRPGARVLDVAAGPGRLTLLAAKEAKSVEAIDFASEMIALLEQRARDAGLINVSARVGDGQALPYESSAFDAVFSDVRLDSLSRSRRRADQDERVLSPGGVAVVSSSAARPKQARTVADG